MTRRKLVKSLGTLAPPLPLSKCSEATQNACIGSPYEYQSLKALVTAWSASTSSSSSSLTGPLSDRTSSMIISFSVATQHNTSLHQLLPASNSLEDEGDNEPEQELRSQRSARNETTHPPFVGMSTSSDNGILLCPKEVLDGSELGLLDGW
jgi:hypothetical protein